MMQRTIVKGCRLYHEPGNNDDQKCLDFVQRLDFPVQAEADNIFNIDTQESQVKNLIQIERAAQKRLPKYYQSNHKILDLQKKLRHIDMRRDNVHSAQLIGQYLVVQCGRYIMYAKCLKNELSEEPLVQQEGAPGLDFQPAKIHFQNTVEITKIWPVDFAASSKDDEQSSDSMIQIVAKDNVQNILLVITWDCERNVEYSMVQVKCDPGTSPENYVVRGMNNKLNYFVDEYQIYDLEYQIPQQSV